MLRTSLVGAEVFSDIPNVLLHQFEPGEPAAAWSAVTEALCPPPVRHLTASLTNAASQKRVRRSLERSWNRLNGMGNWAR
ncbi:hypothetical protein BV25DRAFT_1832238 [Artomyces pyxidatus]|uniref:Uncharacterized protein n=1 Tax=Artomyces pyxidatus TaxID=48021 RepID=A0ACB8SJM5_9AGAM|nr:hypothetical protein BV25DRAFT_1832238 [Artomyces pyxidatus]